MGLEIERKFLVNGDEWREAARGKGREIRQGYLAAGPVAVRVRVAGRRAFIAVKGPKSGYSRLEFEYPVPLADAEAMLKQLCGDLIVEKTRYEIPCEHGVWEVDEFHGANRGLVVAEIELSRPDAPVVPPPWVGAEVSGDPRYANSMLAARPFSTWRNAAPRAQQKNVENSN